MSDALMPRMIFVCGSYRSGTDLLLDFLSVPRMAGWLPDKLAESPANLAAARRVHRQNWFLLGEFFLERRHTWKSVPQPAAADAFLRHYFPAFEPDPEHPVPPGPEQVTPEAREQLRSAVAEVADRERRTNLVLAYNGFPRIRMLREVFPEARFIQPIRDPRSVAYQMVRKIQKVDHAFLDRRQFYIDLMPPELQARLEELPDTPLVFCGVYTRWIHQLYKEELASLPEGAGLEVAYSDLMARPDITLKKVLRFADYPFDKRFAYYLKFHDIQISNLRTNRNLSNEEAEHLIQAVAPLTG